MKFKNYLKTDKNLIAAIVFFVFISLIIALYALYVSNSLKNKWVDGDYIGEGSDNVFSEWSYQEKLLNKRIPLKSDIEFELINSRLEYSQLPEFSCSEPTCINSSFSIINDLFTKEQRYFVSHMFYGQPELNQDEKDIVLLIDISSSMSQTFNADKLNSFDFYKSTPLNINLTHKQMADQISAKVIDRLQRNDKLGVVLFNNEAYIAKDLGIINHSKDQIKQKITSLQVSGSTNMITGLDKTVELLSDSQKQKLIVVLTDSPQELSDDFNKSIEAASKNNIEVLFVNIANQFDEELKSYVYNQSNLSFVEINTNLDYERILNNELYIFTKPIVKQIDVNSQNRFIILNTASNKNYDYIKKEIKYGDRVFILNEFKRSGALQQISLNFKFLNSKSEETELSTELNFANLEADYFDDNFIREKTTTYLYSEVLSSLISQLNAGQGVEMSFDRLNDSQKQKILIMRNYMSEQNKVLKNIYFDEEVEFLDKLLEN